MRALLGCVLLLPFGVIACVGDDNATPGPAPDAGTPVVDGSSPFDATLPDSAVPDSGHDAGTDASTDTGVDAGPLAVTITVVDTKGVPEPGMTVVFHDSTGAVLGTATTSATGQASRVLDAGSMVTALLGNASTPSALTIVGVEPGDLLTAVDTSAARAGNDNVVVDSYPASPPAGTLGYTANAGNCSTGGAAPLTLSIDQGFCENPSGGFPLLVLGTDDSDAVTGFAFAKSAADDGGLDDAGSSHTTLAGGTWSTTFAQETLTATNVYPPDGGYNYGYDHLRLAEVAAGVKYPLIDFSQYYTTTFDGGVATTAAAKGHVGYPDFVQTEMGTELFPNSNSISSISVIATRIAAPTAGQTFTADFGQRLPNIIATSTDVTDAGTGSQPVFSWTSEGSLAATDGAIILATWTGDTDGGAVAGAWTFVVPPTTTSFQAPALPASSAAWIPPGNAGYHNPVFMAFIDGSFLAGYHDLRANVAALPMSSLVRGGPTGYVPPLPVDGTLKLSATQNGD